MVPGHAQVIPGEQPQSDQPPLTKQPPAVNPPLDGKAQGSSETKSGEQPQGGHTQVTSQPPASTQPNDMPADWSCDFETDSGQQSWCGLNHSMSGWQLGDSRTSGSRMVAESGHVYMEVSNTHTEAR